MAGGNLHRADRPTRGRSSSLQDCILWWAGRSAPRWFTWQRATPQTRAPPSNGRRSLVRSRLFLLFFFLFTLAMKCAATGTDSECVSPPTVMAELFANVQDTSAMAYSVSDSDGVCFVPSFSGLQVPCVSVCVVKLFGFCLFYHNYATVPNPISTGDNYITRTGMIIHS